MAFFDNREVCCTLFVFLFLTNFAFSQVSEPNQIEALKIADSPRLDGILDEPCWQEANKISNFTQRELNEGQPVTEKTEVAVVYTDKALYIGVWCYDSEPDKLVAKEMKRDFRFYAEDDFEVIIDTYHDKRNAYLFVTNPNGARADILVTDEGKSRNKDWNGVWDVGAKVTHEGWFAEIEIPFSTLKFPERENQIWGINFERNIRRKKEQVLWQGWSRDYDLEQVSHAGTLVGLHGISGGHLLEIKPFTTGGFEKIPYGKPNYTNKIGGDVNYLLTSNLKLNLTVNTDFAQVESDRLRINLSRFSLYYPEKRDFFLEGRGAFDFGLGRRVSVFYSRRIGIKEGQEIPIICGARLIGKSNRTNIGALSIQTAAKGDEPTTNYTVVRLKQDVLEQSTIGIIATAKNSAALSNYVYGIDGNYVSSKLFGDKNIAIGGAVAQSRTTNESKGRGLSYRFYLSYPNDRVEYDLAVVAVQRDFDPQIGFLRRKNYKMFYTELQFNPRPSFLPWIRKMEFKPIDINYYLTDDTNQLESIGMEWRPLGFGTKSGEWFEYNIQRWYDRPDTSFKIHEGVEIPKGGYWYNRHEIQFESFRGRRIAVEGSVSWGDYYTGSRTEADVTMRLNINKHLNVRTDYQWNALHFTQGRFTTHEIGGRVEYAFNTKLNSSLFGQWNNEDNEIILNFRTNWIPKIGSDVYLVYNQILDTSGGKLRSTNHVLLAKVAYLFQM